MDVKLKKNIKIIFALSIFYVLILITGNVNAASATISESKTVSELVEVLIKAINENREIIKVLEGIGTDKKKKRK